MEEQRRIQGKTDYKARINLLKSGKKRVVFRKTNKYIISQLVKSDEAKDKVILGITSKKLLEYGWPKESSGSLKSLPSCYLTGFLFGKKMLDKGKKQGILDLGLIVSIPKSKPYAFVKGLIDSGISIPHNEKVLPNQEQIKKKTIKNKIDINKIKENIEKKFV